MTIATFRDDWYHYFLLSKHPGDGTEKWSGKNLINNALGVP